MPTNEQTETPALAFLAGGGEMGERMRAFDWSQNPLGEPAEWSNSLKTAVRIMLTSRQPVWIGWGPELIHLYNDPCKAIVGGRHPDALGQALREVWSELWDDIGPMLDRAMRENEGVYLESELFIMERHGYREETYYTFSYSPIPEDDDGGAGGILCANTDDTQRVIGERQLALLRELAARTADTRTWQQACERGAAAFAHDPQDLPFACIYLLRDDVVELAACSGIEAGHAAAPLRLERGADALWPVREALSCGDILVEDIAGRFDALPRAAWRVPPSRVAIVPMATAGPAAPSGALVVGLSPLRALDDGYRRFLGLVVGQLASGIASAQAYDEARMRAEALAELDRAKTAFFSNVSHELRTPLTLMLGPLEEALARPAHGLDAALREDLEIVHRNGLRLRKLVGTMLDFSRIEAGRMQARFEPMALASFTAELASVFRSAVEHAGLRLEIDCPPLSAPVYVDREQWEKIVLNLLSNALKFTLEGEIRVSLCEREDAVELAVSDTGVGIPEDQIERVFERFHRVADARGRSHEGTGIGLSLVRELVHLHGGTVRVTSELDRGSVFLVRLPLGAAHLDSAQVVTAQPASGESVHLDAFLGESMRWLPSRTGGAAADVQAIAATPADAGHTAALPRVLLADDNADMRAYVGRLLSERFAVEAVPDGRSALEAVRARPPELVLADVMMPQLSGFELLAAIRDDPAIRDTPVILLSARAGEEARVEGMDAGADDYLTKPFSARELLARVSAHVQMSRMRQEANAALLAEQARLRLALETGRLGAWQVNIATRELRCSAQCRVNFGVAEDVADDELDIDMLMGGLDPDDREHLRAQARRAISLGGDYDGEYRVVWSDRSVHWLAVRGRALYDEHGRPTHVMGVSLDVTERKHAQHALEAREEWFRTMADTAPALLWVTAPDGSCTFLSRRWYEFTGQGEGEALGSGWLQIVHPDDRARAMTIFLGANGEQRPFALDYRLRRKDGSYRWAIAAGRPRFSDDGAFLGYVGSVIDVHERKQAEEALREADRRKDEFLATLAHELRNPLAPLRTGLELLSVAGADAAEQARTLDMMTRQVSHMVRLVDDLLDMNRIRRGKIQLKRARLELSPLVARAIEATRTVCGRAGVTLVAPPATAIEVHADADRILQVVHNLLHNACKFTPSGGEVQVSVRREGRDAVVCVQDSGIGIDRAHLDGIFEMFAQVDAGNAGSGGGLGIGLTLVKSFVEMHGGSVSAASEGLGQGSVFTMRLPALDPLAAEPPIAAPCAAAPRASVSVSAGARGRGAAQAPDAASLRILVVDDNRDAADTLETLLSYSGHSVKVAFDGLQAVEVAEAFRPEVILLDIGLPRIDGYEACRRIRAQPWARDATLVALTGWGQREDRRKSAEAGFDRHLVKPISSATLLEAIAPGKP